MVLVHMHEFQLFGQALAEAMWCAPPHLRFLCPVDCEPDAVHPELRRCCLSVSIQQSDARR